MKTILVLTDFSKRAEHAAEFAVMIARKVNAKILLYNCFWVPEQGPTMATAAWPMYDPSPLETESLNHLEELATRLKKKMELEGPENNLYTPSIQFENAVGSVEDNIQNAIAENKIWMVVMGTHGMNELTSFIFGSTAFSVIDKVTCPVMLVPENAELENIEKIAYATELKYNDQNNFEFLNELAKSLQSEILITHISPEGLPDKKEEELVTEISSKNQDLKISYIEYKGIDVIKALEEFIDIKNISILAMFHRESHFFDQIFHKGSTTRKMLIHTKTPLLVFPLLKG